MQCHETCRACGFGNSIDPNDRTGAAAAAAINDNPSACVACKDPFVKVDADPYFGDATGCALTCLTNPALTNSQTKHSCSLLPALSALSTPNDGLLATSSCPRVVEEPRRETTSESG